MTMWAIHNLHAPATEVDEDGTATHDGVTRLKLSPALHLADTREDAETWRADRWRGLKQEAAERVAAPVPAEGEE